MEDISTYKTFVSWALAGLASVIGGLFRLVIKKNADTETKLNKKWEECEARHEKSNQTVIRLSSELGELKGTVSTMDQQHQRFYEIHKKTLEALNTHSHDSPKTS